MKYHITYTAATAAETTAYNNCRICHLPCQSHPGIPVNDVPFPTVHSTVCVRSPSTRCERSALSVWGGAGERGGTERGGTERGGWGGALREGERFMLFLHLWLVHLVNNVTLLPWNCSALFSRMLRRCVCAVTSFSCRQRTLYDVLYDVRLAGTTKSFVVVVFFSFLFSSLFFFSFLLLLPIEIVVWRNRVKHYEGKQSTRFGQRSCVFVGHHWRITMWMFSVSKNRRGRETSQIYLLSPGLVNIVCVCVVQAVVIVVVVCSGLWGTFIAIRTRFLCAFLYLRFKQTGLYVCLVELAAVHAAFLPLLSALPTSSADVMSVSSLSPKPTKLPYSYNQPAGHCVVINRAIKSKFPFRETTATTKLKYQESM